MIQPQSATIRITIIFAVCLGFMESSMGLGWSLHPVMVMWQRHQTEVVDVWTWDRGKACVCWKSQSKMANWLRFRSGGNDLSVSIFPCTWKPLLVQSQRESEEFFPADSCLCLCSVGWRVSIVSFPGGTRSHSLGTDVRHTPTTNAPDGWASPSSLPSSLKPGKQSVCQIDDGKLAKW